MLTVLDIIHLIQYYYHTASYDSAAADVEHFKLESLRGNVTPPCAYAFPKGLNNLAEIESRLGVATPPMLRSHPSSSLYDAAKVLIQTPARRLPLLDNDSETGHEVIISVLTQYRLLKFISINVRTAQPTHPAPLITDAPTQLTKEISQLHGSLRKLKIGTYVQGPITGAEPSEGHNPYAPIATATLTTPVLEVVHMFSERSISAVPIIDEEGVVVNLYETVDVIVRSPFRSV